MKFELSYYDLEYFLKKKREYEENKSWKIEPFFNDLKVRGRTVLDYGSASGNMARQANHMQAAKIIAYDPVYDNNPKLVESIKIDGIKYITTKELNKTNDKFDLIFCSDVIEHVIPEEVGIFIRSMIRFAHNNTIICLNSPVKINLASIFGKPLASSTVGHINVMNVWKVKNLFKQNNYFLIDKPLILGVSKKKIVKLLEKLSYPLNTVWGGHYFLRFKIRTA